MALDHRLIDTKEQLTAGDCHCQLLPSLHLASCEAGAESAELGVIRCIHNGSCRQFLSSTSNMNPIAAPRSQRLELRQDLTLQSHS